MKTTHFPSDEETTIEHYRKEEDEDVLFLRQQALKSMPEALGNQDHQPSPVDIQHSAIPSTLQEGNTAFEMADLSKEPQSVVQHQWTCENSREVENLSQEMFPDGNLQGIQINPQHPGEPKKRVEGQNLEEDKREQEDSFKLVRLQVPSFIRVRDKTELIGTKSVIAHHRDDIDMEVANNAEDQFFRDQMNPDLQKSSHFYWSMTSQPPSLDYPCGGLLSSSTREQSEACLEASLSEKTAHNKIGMLKRRLPDCSQKVLDTKVAKGTQSDNVQGESFVCKATIIKSKKMSDNNSNKKELIAKPLTDKSDTVKVASSFQHVQSQSTVKTNLFLPTLKSLKGSNSTNKKALSTKVISSLQDEDTMKKHFPNLFTTTIISLSDSENEDLVEGENKYLKNHSLINSEEFEANLNSFLKSIRAKEEFKSIPPPKPVRKNPPAKFSKPKTKVLGKPNNSADQANSILMLMPPEKQEEYKRLKAIIEKKENAKKLVAPNKLVAPVGPATLLPPEPSESENQGKNSENLQGHQENEVEDENDLEAQLLREKLLLSMKKKKKAAIGHGIPKQPLAVSNNRPQKTRKVSLRYDQEECKHATDGTLENVLPEAEHEGSTSQESEIQSTSDEHLHSSSECAPPDSGGTVDDLQVLKDSEKMLFLSRIAMIQRLTKLSEENLLFKKERIRVLQTEKFAEDLRNQLSQVEEILANQNRRLDQLRTTMKGTYNDLFPLGCRMAEAEKLCLSNGLIVHGSKYSISKKGTEKIEVLWSGIRHNVRTLLTIENEAKQSGEKVAEQEKPASSFQECSKSTCDQWANETVADVSPITSDPPQQACSTSLENVNANGLKQVELYEGTALEHLKAQNGIQLDPFQNLCPFWLTGKCNDEACQFQHI